MNREQLLRLFDLSGRVVIVTGGTRGIGRALAEGYVSAGARVVVASRKADACKETEEQRHVDHQNDLTPDRVFETFVTDLRAKRVDFEVPSDPMHDPGFIALLAKTYDVGPSSHPAEAPVAAHAA